MKPISRERLLEWCMANRKVRKLHTSNTYNDGFDDAIHELYDAMDSGELDPEPEPEKPRVEY